METLFFFKNMLPMEEQKLRDYFLSKLPKFEKIVKRFSEDSVIMNVRGEKFDKHSAYEVEVVMKMPRMTFTAREASHTINKAVDLAKDRLDMQLKRAMLHRRRSHRSIRAQNKLRLRVAA